MKNSPPVQGGRQRGGQPVPGDGTRVGLRVGELEAVAARRLGPVHRDVGAAQHLGGAALPGGPLDDADRAADRQFTAVEADGGGERVQDAAGQFVHLVGGVRSGGEGDELVAAEPGDHLAGRRRTALQPVRDLDQEPVAGRVAEAVVDGLEAVEVQVAEAEADAFLSGEGLLQTFEEQGPVGQSGERVVGGLVAQPQIQQPPLGGVLHQRKLVLGTPFGVPQQRNGEVGPQDGAVVAVVRLLDPVVVAFAAYQLVVVLPHLRRVLGVDPLVHLVAADVVLETAEHLGEGVVDLQDVAVQVGDADADGRVLEDRAEACLGGVQGLFGVRAGGQRRAGDGLLLGERALAQGRREAGGQRVLDPGAAGPAVLGGERFRSVAAAVQHEVGVDDAERGAEGVRVGAVRVDQGRADPLGGRGVEGAGVQDAVQLACQGQQMLFELRPGEGGGGQGEDGPAPDPGESPEPAFRAVWFRVRFPGRLGGNAHALRPTPAKPEKAYGSSCSGACGLSGRQAGIDTSPGSTIS